MAVDEGVVREVPRQGGLADAIGPDQDDVGGLLQEVEGHQCLEKDAVAAFRPGPVEVAERFEAPEMGSAEAAFEAAASALLLLPVEQGSHPASGDGFRPMRQEAVQMERF